MTEHPERRLTIAVNDYMTRFARPGLVFTHFPAGEYRSAKTGGLLRRMGLKRGWPDVLILGAGGVLFGLELKTEKGRQSPEQKLVEQQFRDSGAIYILAKGFDAAIDALAKWGLVEDVR